MNGYICITSLMHSVFCLIICSNITSVLVFFVRRPRFYLFIAQNDLSLQLIIILLYGTVVLLPRFFRILPCLFPFVLIEQYMVCYEPYQEN